MLTEREDVGCAHSIPRGRCAAVRATIYPTMLAPLPAYGTRLRAVCLVNRNRACGFVVELIDELAGTCLANSLRLCAPCSLRGVIEWFTHITQCMREGVGHLPSRLVAQITEAPLGLVEQLVLATLQSHVSARAFGLGRLGLLDAGKLLVAILNRSLGGTPADKNYLAPIGGSNEGVHAQIHTDNHTLRPLHVGYFTDQPYHPIGKAVFHQSTGQRNGIWQGDAQGATCAMRQDEPPSPYARILVSVRHVVMAAESPRVACLRIAILAELSARVHSLAKLTNKLLGRLGRQAAISPARPSLPARLARPSPIETPNALVTHDQIVPEPCRLFAAGAEGGPLSDVVWLRYKFYRAIAYTYNIPGRRTIAKWRLNGSWESRPSPIGVKAGTLNQDLW